MTDWYGYGFFYFWLLSIRSRLVEKKKLSNYLRISFSQNAIWRKCRCHCGCWWWADHFLFFWILIHRVPLILFCSELNHKKLATKLSSVCLFVFIFATSHLSLSLPVSLHAVINSWVIIFQCHYNSPVKTFYWMRTVSYAVWWNTRKYCIYMYTHFDRSSTRIKQ